MLSWSDLHPCFQNAAIVVGFVALATVVDITLFICRCNANNHGCLL